MPRGGLAVGQALATELKLSYPEMPWHTQRDRLAALICACGVLTGALGKMARDISLLMEYKGMTVAQAAAEVINRKLKVAGGEGAAIALDPHGNFAMAHNTEGLYRGYVTSDGKIAVMLYEK